MAERNLYLSNTPVEEAKQKYMAALAPFLAPQYETVPVIQALGRVTGKAVFARYSSPLFNAAAMDGIAVSSAKTAAARETAPLDLRPGEDYAVVDTGDPIRFPFDAVIMAEDIAETENGVRIFASAAPWQHVRPVGEDIVAGEMILPSSHRIRPIDIGVLLSAGILHLEVWQKPKVAIFPTGSEIIEPTEDPGEGDIIESNSRMFEAMVTEYGGEGHRYPPIPDDYARIRDAVSRAIDSHELVIINAGSSAGTEDYTVHVLRELGEVVIHGVAVKPGKPVILAIVRGKPVIGLPGYPVSAYIAFENFVTPVLTALSGKAAEKANVVEAISARRMVSSLKHREYVRVKLGRVDGKLVAAPLARGAGAAMSLVRADGFGIIEQNVEGVEAGETIRVQLSRGLEEIENTLVVVGSHDMILDAASDRMAAMFKNIFLSSTHVGSMAGLMALKRGEAHVAPSHLLDEETGIYNIAAIKRIFTEPMVLIKGVHRIQGILVKKGNPLNIQSVADLVRVRYVNRQRGAGTRVLLDYKLKQAGISPEDIPGYSREAATHMAVAALVASDSADAGLGIYSAARAMDLDFIEVGPEEYDFVLRAKDLELEQVKAFLSVLTSEEFQKSILELGGYACPETGKIVYIGP
jgi:putative molybdopterin biosynthesis protein